MKTNPTRTVPTKGIYLGIILVFCALLGLSSGPTSASALWQHDYWIETSLNTGQLSRPTNLVCTSNNSILSGSVKVAWSKVPHAEKYKVYARKLPLLLEPASQYKNIGSVNQVENPSFVIETSILEILENLISFLLGGGKIELYIEAELGEKWVSAKSETTIISRNILVGLKCG